MKPFRVVVFVALACFAGVVVSELIYRSSFCREFIARFGGHGELLALIHGQGIYRADLDAQADGDLSALIVEANLNFASKREKISNEEIKRELNLLVAQFGEEKIFAKALDHAGLTKDSLRCEVTKHLQARAWLEREIALTLVVTEDECRQVYDSKLDQFVQPQRFRARHLFLSAHEGTPPEQMEAKRQAIGTFAARIAQGESMAQLAPAASEDESTKKQGGDLGFFSASRVPQDFVAEIATLAVGQITPPFQTNLGFHIAELTETRPAQRLDFQEAEREIAGALADEKRSEAVASIRQEFATADFVRAARR